MSGVTLIGDVHGREKDYKFITSICKKSICLGDYGFKAHWDRIDQDTDSHKILMGNHDYIPYCEAHPASLGNFGMWEGIFFIRGAASIDKAYRVPGRDWFDNEELSTTQMNQCYDQYVSSKPKVVISHDCPSVVAAKLFNIYDRNSTRSFLQALFEQHKPERWVFGHHHRSISFNIDECEFKCLDELEVYILPLF